MKKIIHIITGLNNGGAEAMLYKLLCEMDQSQYRVEVISMMGLGVMGLPIRQLGVSVHCLSLNKKKNPLSAIVEATRICRDADIIQCWMYHANLFGYIVNLFCNKKLIWGIRRGHLILQKDKDLTIKVARICAKFSGRVSTIVYCAQKSRFFHEKIGYHSENACVIPNGFDLDRFCRSDNVRVSFRETEGIPQSALVIAFIGRYSPVKGYENFIEAFSLLTHMFDGEIIALCAGTEVQDSNTQLMKVIKTYGQENNIKLLGRREDIPNILSAADVFVSASFTEAFSNAIGEAMACELPCVVTDVGDSGYIVGDTGVVLENNNPELLAQGIRSVLDLNKEQRSVMGKKARQRVQELFDIKVVVKQYEQLYK